MGYGEKKSGRRKGVELNIHIQRNEPEGVTTWTYDQEWIGGLDLVVAPVNYEQSLDYDALGRPEAVRTKLDGEIHLVETTFDAQSRPAQITYPGGYKIQHVYNTHGYHTEVRRSSNNALLWKLDHLDAFGNVDIQTLGNGVSTTTHHDQARGHVDAITTGVSGGSTLQNLEYQWDEVGTESVAYADKVG